MPGEFIPAGPYVPPGSGGGGSVAHNDTTNRNNSSAHTIGAIVNLQASLDERAPVRKIDTFGFTGNGEPMASGGLTVYTAFAPGYPLQSITVAEGSKVLMLNLSNGSCSLWTAHAAAPWEAASMTGWAAQDELQTRLPAMRGRLIAANYGGGPILVPEWDQTLYIDQSIDLAIEPLVAEASITPPPPMPPGSLALHSTGEFSERWVSVDGSGDPEFPLPATTTVEIIVHAIPRKLPASVVTLPSFGEWSTYNAPDDDPGADAQELATYYTPLDGSDSVVSTPGRIVLFWEWMWAGETIEDSSRMHVDIGMRLDFPSYFRLWMDATTGYMSISVLANEGADLVESQGRLWKVIAEQTVPPAGRVLHNPDSPMWLMTSCPGDAFTIERWHDGTKICDVDASLLPPAANDFVDKVGQRWVSSTGSVQPVNGVAPALDNDGNPVFLFNVDPELDEDGYNSVVLSRRGVSYNGGDTEMSSVSVTADYTLASHDNWVIADAVGGDIDLTLPSFAPIGKQYLLTRSNETGGAVLIVNTILGHADALDPLETLSVRWDGFDWRAS